MFLWCNYDFSEKRFLVYNCNLFHTQEKFVITAKLITVGILLPDRSKGKVGIVQSLTCCHHFREKKLNFKACLKDMIFFIDFDQDLSRNVKANHIN